jgi:hypothetical protein
MTGEDNQSLDTFFHRQAFFSTARDGRRRTRRQLVSGTDLNVGREQVPR